MSQQRSDEELQALLNNLMDEEGDERVYEIICQVREERKELRGVELINSEEAASLAGVTQESVRR